MKLAVSIVTLLLSWSFCSTLSAQISEEDRSMSQGVKNGFVLEIPNTNTKVVEKVWKKYVKQYSGKTKKDRKSDEWFTDNAIARDIAGGLNAMDIYASIEDSGDGVRFTTWYDLGGAYLNSYEHGEQVDEAQKMLMVFAIEVAKEMTRIELEQEEKRLKDLDNTLKKLVRAKEGYEKEIEAAKERIAKAEANIETNIKDQENTHDQIEAQKEVIKEVEEKLSDLDN